MMRAVLNWKYYWNTTCIIEKRLLVKLHTSHFLHVIQSQCRAYFDYKKGWPSAILHFTSDTLRMPNRYTRLENLAGSHSVFIKFSFCRKRRFMKPLLLFRVAIFSSQYRVSFFNRYPPRNKVSIFIFYLVFSFPTLLLTHCFIYW